MIMQGTETARIEEVLSKISSKIHDEDFLAKLERFLQDKKEKSNTVPESVMNVFSVYTSEGKEGLRSKLESFDVKQLTTIIRKNALDPSGLSHRWKTKDKLVSLIVSRTSGRMEKGKVFLEYK
ncbi:hypothetical protein Barb7_02515 [Bacteroidales bacterium Barb7]|nr:hypothetical protein Barb7_02515 [Bacteroidales bacterium Barb7]